MEAGVAPPLTGRWRVWGFEALALGIVVAMALKMAWGAELVRDIHLGDESFFYLMPGCELPERGLPEASMGPLYCVWYYLLSLMIPDRVQLFHGSWLLLSTLVTVGFYTLVRTLGGGRVVGLIATYLVITSRLLDADPYPSHLAAVFVLTGAIAAALARSAVGAGVGLSLSLLLAAYVRPEWYLAFLLGCGLEVALVAWAWRRGTLGWRGFVTAPLTLAAAAGLCSAVFGNPLGGQRSFIAFGQHYAMRAGLAANAPADAFIYWTPLVEADFGKARSFGEALRVNPAAVGWHISCNLGDLPHQANYLVNTRVDRPRLLRLGARCLLAIGVLVGAWGCVRLWRRRDGSGPERTALRDLLPLALVLPPTLAMCLLIHPRVHYLLLALLLIGALTASGWCAWQARVTRWADSGSALMTAAVGLLLIVLTPNIAYGLKAVDLCQQAPLKKAPTLPVLATIRQVAALEMATPIRLLEHGFTPVYYTGLPYTAVKPPLRAGQGFARFLCEADIHLVIVGPYLTATPWLKEDAQFQQFVSGASTDAFQRVPVAGTEFSLMVRRDRLRGQVE